ncbi:MAG: Uma2 family endonuclease [Chloroflexota bacterium]
MVAARPMSAAELAALPDDERGELLDGVMLPITPVKEEHWRIVSVLQGTIWQYLRERNLGIVGPERGYLLGADPDTVLAPDISFVSHARNIPDRDLPGFAPLAPDLAVEVRSPSNTAAEMPQRVARYLAAGALLVWVVDPAARTISVHSPGAEHLTLHEGDVLEGGAVLPGFSIAVSDVFA